MALQEQKINVVFGQGVDQKTGDQIVMHTQLTTLENGYYKKANKLRMRNGHTALAVTKQGGGSIAAGRSFIERKDELVMVDSTEVFSRGAENAEWVSKGELTNTSLDIKSIIQNSYGQSFQDCAKSSSSGLELYAWMDSNDMTVRASVYDPSSGTYVLSNVEIFNEATTPTYVSPIRCFAIGTHLFVCYIDASTLKGKRLDTADPSAFESEFTIATSVNTNSRGFDIVEYDSGAAAWAVNYTNDDEVRYGYLLEDKTLGNGSNGYAAPATVTDAVEHLSNSMCLITDGTDLFLTWVNRQRSTSVEGVYIEAREADLTQKFAAVAIETDTSSTLLPHFFRIGACFDSGGDICVLYEFSEQLDATYRHSRSTEIRKVAVTTAGSVGAIESFLMNSAIASLPWLYNSKVHVNVLFAGAAIYGSLNNNFDIDQVSAQPTGFTVDEDKEVLSRWLVGEAFLSYVLAFGVPDNSDFTRRIHTPSKVLSPSAGTYVFPMQILSEPVVLIEIQRPGREFPQDGIGLVRVENGLAATPRLQAIQSGENSYIMPSQMKVYDGSQVVETGFYVYPDYVEEIADVEIAFSVNQQGSGGAPEIVDWVMTPAAALHNNGWIRLRHPSGNFTVGFDIDGKGNSSHFDITASLDSDDTDDEVATKVAAAIDANANFAAAVVSLTTVRVTNDTNGSVTDPSINDVNAHGPRALGDGSYRYQAVYMWKDLNGEVHRSAPSPITEVVRDSGNFTFQAVAIPSLQLTSKSTTASPVVVELYRTTAGGSVFYKTKTEIYDFTGDPSGSDLVAEGKEARPEVINDPSRRWIYFIDNLTDAELVSQQLLYAQAGILENICPPYGTAILNHQKRVLVTGFAYRKNRVWISKEKVPGTGLSFNDTVIVDLDPIGGDNTALAKMDEKYIIFQNTAAWWMTGTPPNDLGQGSTLIEPQHIDLEVGCPYPLSISNFPEGVLFKSLRGWYHLSRSLQLSYIGAMVEDMNALTVTSVKVIKDLHQIRVTHSDGSMIVYDWFFKTWSVWTGLSASDSVIVDNVFYLLKSNGEVWKEDSTTFLDDGTEIVMTLETGWLRVGDLSNLQRVRRAHFIGEFPLQYKQVLKTKVDYSSTVVDTIEFEPTGSAAVKFEAHMVKQKSDSMRFRINTERNGGDAVTEITSLILVAAMKRKAKFSASFQVG